MGEIVLGTLLGLISCFVVRYHVVCSVNVIYRTPPIMFGSCVAILTVVAIMSGIRIMAEMGLCGDLCLDGSTEVDHLIN